MRRLVIASVTSRGYMHYLKCVGVFKVTMNCFVTVSESYGVTMNCMVIVSAMSGGTMHYLVIVSVTSGGTITCFVMVIKCDFWGNNIHALSCH